MRGVVVTIATGLVCATVVGCIVAGADADVVVDVSLLLGTHGGADAPLIDEFLRYVRAGGATLTAPVAARYAVAAGFAATESLRDGGRPVDVPPLDADLEAYFSAMTPGRGTPLRPTGSTSARRDGR